MQIVLLISPLNSHRLVIIARQLRMIFFQHHDGALVEDLIEVAQVAEDLDDGPAIVAIAQVAGFVSGDAAKNMTERVASQAHHG